ncbi:GNAT family N-acetyltransferase [Fibrivirga algicola]|uniref:GNAT family N-acetyltransferase n=1 Tax=Fibrivirga algicola TaxID=2950420 RepID=A0ABX0QBK7_9BACT|nr:GNAT family N-acetyltransferase [Fibrivirga algicola]NID08556.1 GNAT family N-acetyltransferase [Fibrivirga algicola]
MITYQTYGGLPPEPMLGQLLDILSRLFISQSREAWLVDLTQKATTYLDFQTILAVADGQVVGCKLGYDWHLTADKPGEAAATKRTFYSWLGGVDPAYRGRGIAGALMQLQHEACQQAGYVAVRTHTYNQWRDMLIMNLRQGFQIIGTQPGKHGLTIMLEKELT